jgi:hypothetical protein
MNTQERSFYNNVTGFSPTAITGVIRRLDRQHKKSIELQVELGKELRTAKEWYNSEEAQAEMDDAGITYNSICEFFQSVAGGRKKSACYKLIKAANNVDANDNAVSEFVEACKQAVEDGESPKRNIEAFNKFCASGEAEVRETEETESEESEETESEENQSDDSGTKFSFSMKAVDGESGACIRLDESYNIIAEDGNGDEVRRAITKYLSTIGYDVVARV